MNLSLVKANHLRNHSHQFLLPTANKSSQCTMDTWPNTKVFMTSYMFPLLNTCYSMLQCLILGCINLMKLLAVPAVSWKKEWYERGNVRIYPLIDKMRNTYEGLLACFRSVTKDNLKD